jgi:hypothetical protein
MTLEYIRSQFLNEDEFEQVLRYDQEMLNRWANRITQFYWNVPFNIPISYEDKTGMGDFAYGQFSINLLNGEQKLCISKRMVKHNYYNPLMVEKILKHEIAHWYIFNYNDMQGFRDGETRFEEEVRRIDSVSQFDVSAGLVKVISHRPKKLRAAN